MARLDGTAQNDELIWFNAEPVEIYGYAGDDTLVGDAGNDLIVGGSGSDSLLGDPGNDVIYGGRDSDSMYGGLGADQLFGGKGDDYLVSGFDTDTLTGGGGSDTFGLIGEGVAIITDFNAASDFLRLVDNLTGSRVLVARNNSNSVGVYVSSNGGSSFDKVLALLTNFNGDVGSVSAKVIGGNVTGSPTPTPAPTPTPIPTPTPTPTPISGSTGTPGLDPEERSALDYLNSARQNPQAAGQQLGINLSGVTPRPPLTPDPILNQVAQQRADDLAARNYFDHVDPDGLGPNIKVQRAGYPLPSFYLGNPANNFIESLSTVYTVGNSSSFGTSGKDQIATLLVDAGTSPPGHRIHLLALNDFYGKHTDVGIGYTSVTRGNQTSYYMAVLTAYKA
ncbi:CAP domain-containing protein [Microcoleus sp. herbarium12]|uniref:CAP domain-containing protein n=1 Tax=Microcoleus sp. herbarium12 TaxID=3055437 RepID=UPI002FD0D080